ncbi:hypothetical protein Tco_0481355 [Tanacetum coccineum]
MTGHECSDQMYALGVSPCEEDDEFKESEVEQFGIKELTRGGHKVLMSEWKKICLRGTQQSKLQWLSGKKLHKQLVGDTSAYVPSVSCIWPSATLQLMQSTKMYEAKYHPKLEHLLQKFEDVFAVSSTLPPQREDDDGSTLAGATACLSVYEETTSEEQGCRR